MIIQAHCVLIFLLHIAWQTFWIICTSHLKIRGIVTSYRQQNIYAVFNITSCLHVVSIFLSVFGTKCHLLHIDLCSEPMFSVHVLSPCSQSKTFMFRTGNSRWINHIGPNLYVHTLYSSSPHSENIQSFTYLKPN